MYPSWCVASVCAAFLCSSGAEALYPGLARAHDLRPAFHDVLPDVVERVMNGVVNIRTTDAHQSTVSQGNGSTDDFFSLFTGTVGRKPSEKSSSVGRSLGSGFFYGSRETIVTNLHVVKDAAAIVVFATELSVYRSAEILGADPVMDLAVLKIKPVDGAGVLEFGKSDQLRLAERVFAIGNPFGYGNTVTSGILSAKGRSVGSGALSFLLQTDVPMNPGNSGGPLFNMKGEVVGINTANVVGAQGISFAIPGEMAQRRIESLLRSGQPVQTWIGLYAEDILDLPQFETRSYGVSVRSVVSGAPAGQAGVQSGDVIRKVNDERIADLADLERIVRALDEGKDVRIEVYRAGRTHVFRLRPISRPSKFRQSTDLTLL